MLQISNFDRKKNQTVKIKKKQNKKTHNICLIILHWQEVPHPSTSGGDVARNSLVAKIISNSIIIIFLGCICN
jgi:hypothetical protein